jgi:outer membrane protein TolC
MRQRTIYLILGLVLITQFLIIHTAKAKTQQAGENNVNSSTTFKASFTLEECLEIAQQNNPDLAQLKAATEISKADTGIAKSKTRPIVKGELGFLHSVTEFLTSTIFFPATWCFQRLFIPATDCKIV